MDSLQAMPSGVRNQFSGDTDGPVTSTFVKEEATVRQSHYCPKWRLFEHVGSSSPVDEWLGDSEKIEKRQFRHARDVHAANVGMRDSLRHAPIDRCSAA